MASVSLTVDMKTDILQGICKKLSIAATAKITNPPNLSEIVTRAYNNWFNQEVRPHLGEHLIKMIPAEKANGDYQIPNTLPYFKSLPNIVINYSKGRNRDRSKSKIGGSNFSIGGKNTKSTSAAKVDYLDVEARAKLPDNTMFSAIEIPKNHIIVEQGYYGDNVKYNTRRLQPNHFNEEDIQALTLHNELVESTLENLHKQVHQISLQIINITSSKKFRDTLPQLVSLLPYSVIEAEARNKSTPSTPRPKKQLDENGEELDIDQLRKDLAMGALIGD